MLHKFVGEAMTYKIVRFFFLEHPSKVIDTGLTLKQAKEHCGSPETSSSTCTGEEGLATTAMYGPWFDGYDEE